MRLLSGLAAMLFVGAAGYASAADLIVVVHGIKSARGDLRIAVYGEEDSDTFPDSKAGLAAGIRIRAAAIPGANASVRVALGPLLPGRYAVSVIHDSNGNGELDRNLLGMPSEGYGFSAGAEGRFGPPSFDDAAVNVGSSDDAETVITLAY